MQHSKLHNSYSLPPKLIFTLFASFAARTYDSIATFRFMVSKTFLMVLGRWGVAVRGGGCAGISPEAEGRATQWSRGVGRRLRVDGDCVVSPVDCPWWGGRPMTTARRLSVSCPCPVHSVPVCRPCAVCQRSVFKSVFRLWQVRHLSIVRRFCGFAKESG